MNAYLQRTAMLLGLLAFGAVANAVPILASARLDSAQEQAAGVNSTSGALGAAVLTVEPTTGEFDFSLEVTGIEPGDLADLDLGAAISSIHLHNAPAGVNGPVVVDLGGGNANLNVTPFGLNGFSVNIDGGFFGGLLGATLADSNTNLASLLQEELYINVHTNDFLGGEIRGQLIPVQQQLDPQGQVPEPGAFGLVALALVGAGLRRRSR